ncbi:MAG: hypothetical protein IKA95_00865 [Clostridia bacterium]|nr:hypothetical protein [Clostridia bacterium]
MIKSASLTLALVMIFTLCFPAFGAYASQDGANAAPVILQDNITDVDTIIARWKKSLVGDESNDTSKAHVESYINAIDTACKSAFDTMSTADGTSPWKGSLTASAHLTHCFEQTERMAKGYTAKGSAYYNNKEVLASIEYALGWLFEKYYFPEMATINDGNDYHWSVSASTGFTGKNDWYDWFIASSRSLINTLILLENDLDADLKESGLKVIESFVPDLDNPLATSLYAERGSNSIYYMKIRIGTTLLRGDTTKLKAFLKNLEPEFTYVTGAGQGFHADGTYLYHTKHFLNGTYGSEHFEMLPEIAALVRNTEFAFNPKLVAQLFEIYRNAFEPLIYGENVIPMATGRAPYGSVATSAAKRIMKASLSMITLFENNAQYSDECAQTKIRIKEYYSNPTNLGTLTIELAEQAYAIVNDASISDAAHYRATKIYPDGDKAVHHTDSFMTAISMSSSRTYNYESLHDGYTKGWYMGDGMQYTYMEGDTQYDANWFKGSDPYKRPGTTVDTQPRADARVKQGDEYLSSKDFVGGVSLGNTGVAAMDLESYHNDKEGTSAPVHSSTLTAKKSWFMFDDEVVSLGADIRAKDGFEVLTVVDNRNLPNEDIYVNGTLADITNHISVAHLNYGNKIGYVFPNTQNVTLGATGSYVESWISHGTNPSGAAYAYITLPCTTSAETAAYANAPDATILSNTSSVQAVKDNSTNTTGYVFWEAATFDGISAANPCTVVKKVENGLVTMAVSDPTHKLSSITLTLNGTVATLGGAPANVTFKEANGNTVITINSSDCSGEGYEFSYRVPSEAYVEIIELSLQGDNIIADFTVGNHSSADAANLATYLALYDSEGKLTSVTVKTVAVSAKGTIRASLLLPKQGACTAKAFVWEGGESLDGTTKMSF